ncbi:uncharacterized protein V1510DRAFT_427718 [Dipodascopsis tothii]|uniref:uncharacterized protein n=1 Tax=Dipodascopsis tothii TaxID=44089 RepID=UPI0034CD7DF1
MFRSFYARYNALLTQRPLLTQATTSGFLFGAGDALAQTLSPGKDERYDYMRTARMSFYGGVIFAPVVSHWYRFVTKTIVIPGRPNLEAVARMTADQTIFAPNGIAAFYVGMGLLEAKSWDEIKQDLSDKWYPTMVGNYVVWPAVQIINFRFIPLAYRLLFVNSVSIGWNAFMSFINSEPDVGEALHKIEEAEEALEEKAVELEKKAEKVIERRH